MSRKWRNWYQNEVVEEIKGVEKHNGKQTVWFLPVSHQLPKSAID